MKPWAKFVCALTGSYYSVAGTLLFFFPAFFFNHVGPYGAYNEHYAVDVGSFLLPLGASLLIVIWRERWLPAIAGPAAVGSTLHAISHLRDGSNSMASVLGNLSLILVALLLGLVFWTGLPAAADEPVDAR